MSVLPSLCRAGRRAVIAAIAAATVIAMRPDRVAAQNAAASAEARPWFAGIGTGWYFPTQQWPTAYHVGGGGTLMLGRVLAPHWALQLDVNQWLLAGSARSTWDLKAGPMLRWSPRAAAATPFLLAGVGIDAQTDYPARQSTASAMIPLGAGVELRSGVNSAVFIEAMDYVVVERVATRDIPLLLGFRLGF